MKYVLDLDARFYINKISAFFLSTWLVVLINLSLILVQIYIYKKVQSKGHFPNHYLLQFEMKETRNFM